MKVEHLLSANAQLGEGPLWSASKKCLYWLDIVAPAIHRFDPETGLDELTNLTQWVCALVETADGGTLGAVEDGLAFIDPETGKIDVIANPLPDSKRRFNDGSCDRRGRFWSGSMMKGEPYDGGNSLYKLDTDLTVTEMDTGLILSNGIGFSPDDTIMYLSDSVQKTVFAYDFDLHEGSIKNRRPLITVADDDGFPDGLTVDSEGCIWLCHWDGARVTRHSPDGSIIDFIEMPVPRPTSCIFGGSDLSTLFITSARQNLDEDELEKSPLSGDLFAVSLSIPGLPEPKFAGKFEIEESIHT